MAGGAAALTATIANLTNVATTIDVVSSGLVLNAYYFLQTSAQVETIQVTSAPTAVTGGYRYTIGRNLSFAKAWTTGSTLHAVSQQTGRGYIDLTSTATIHNALGPTQTIYSRTGTTNWNDVKPVTTMGNLRSFVDYTSDTFGWGVGNDLTLSPTSGFSGMTGDAVSGLRMFNTTQKMYTGGSEFFRISAGSGLNIMAATTIPANYGSMPTVNGITFFRDSIGGNRSGQFTSQYDPVYGTETYIAGYDSSAGAAKTAVVALDSAGESSAGVFLRAYKPSFQLGYANLASFGSMELVSGWGEIAMGSGGMFFGDNGLGTLLDLDTGAFQNLNNGIAFNHSAWANMPTAKRSEITNDLSTYKQLMVVGNTSNGGSNRRVGVWDQLQVGGATFVSAFNVNGAIYLMNMTAPSTPSGGGVIYCNAGKLYYKGSSGTQTLLGNA